MICVLVLKFLLDGGDVVCCISKPASTDKNDSGSPLQTWRGKLSFFCVPVKSSFNEELTFRPCSAKLAVQVADNGLGSG